MPSRSTLGMMSQPMPSSGAQLLQPLGVALPHVAEVEVVAGHHVDRPVLLHQVLGDKVLPGHAHHALSKWATITSWMP